MRKNLLLVHLESLNIINFELNQELFPHLRKIKEQCIWFPQYYSTATSTLMVIGDLLYGGMDQYEQSETLDSVPDDYCYKDSWFDVLKAHGYHTGIYIFPDGNNRESAEEKHLAGFHNQMWLRRDYKAYLSEFERGMKKSPFALMACNYISNLAFDSMTSPNQRGLKTDCWESGYRVLDEQVGDLWNLLSEQDLLKETVVVFYGDHGDDYWTHGTHEGITHGIEPTTLLIHTPLFIWHPVEQPHVEDGLIQTTDLRWMLEKVLLSDEDMRMAGRPYAYARNAYARQPIRQSTFNKAYSVTDGTFLLLVSSKGLSLYNVKMDPGCHNNFLRFFCLSDGVLKKNETALYLEQRLLHGYWRERHKRLIRQAFYELKKVLYEKTRHTYLAGKRTEQDLRKEMRFDRIDYEA